MSWKKSERTSAYCDMSLLLFACTFYISVAFPNLVSPKVSHQDFDWRSFYQGIHKLVQNHQATQNSCLYFIHAQMNNVCISFLSFAICEKTEAIKQIEQDFFYSVNLIYCDIRVFLSTIHASSQRLQLSIFMTEENKKIWQRSNQLIGYRVSSQYKSWRYSYEVNQVGLVAADITVILKSKPIICHRHFKGIK